MLCEVGRSAQDDTALKQKCYEQDIAEKDRRLHSGRDHRIWHQSITTFTPHQYRTQSPNSAIGRCTGRRSGKYPLLSPGTNQSRERETAASCLDFRHRRIGWTSNRPIIVGDVLYAYSPSQRVIALNAATGKLLWKFDPAVHGWQPARGLAYWSDGKDKRILAGVMDSVYALDADTGEPISTFGESGRIDLRKDLGRDPETQSIALTSPGVVYKDLLIVGGREPETLPAPPGDIRAYHVRTRKLVWSFHTIPHPGEFGDDTWPKDAWKYIGSANNWAGMTVDSKRGILYVPTGSAPWISTAQIGSATTSLPTASLR